jgi:hypothetical protein
MCLFWIKKASVAFDHYSLSVSELIYLGGKPINNTQIIAAELEKSWPCHGLVGMATGHLKASAGKHGLRYSCCYKKGTGEDLASAFLSLHGRSHVNV